MSGIAATALKAARNGLVIRHNHFTTFSAVSKVH